MAAGPDGDPAPQLVLPQGADQPFNTELVERAGAGRRLTGGAQLSGEVGTAIGALLADGPERVAAKRIAAEIAALPGPTDLAASLDRRTSTATWAAVPAGPRGRP